MGKMSNPFGYSETWGIERHRDDLIGRLGEAIKRINTAEARIRELEQALRKARSMLEIIRMLDRDEIGDCIGIAGEALAALHVRDKAAQK